MPTYDYRCLVCGHVTEVVHAMSADGPTACERCGGELQRVFHPAGIIFRGTGFYSTDSRPTGSAGESGGSSPASTDSKPASPPSTSGSGD